MARTLKKCLFLSICLDPCAHSLTLKTQLPMHWECLFVRSLLGPGDCLLGKSVSDMSVEVGGKGVERESRGKEVKEVQQKEREDMISG